MVVDTLEVEVGSTLQEGKATTLEDKAIILEEVSAIQVSAEVLAAQDLEAQVRARPLRVRVLNPPIMEEVENTTCHRLSKLSIVTDVDHLC